MDAAVFHEDVADVAAHLATDAEAVDAGVEIAVADEDAFGGAGDAPGVLVAAGFDGDAVVAGAESAAFDENIGAGVGVAAVVVVVEAFDGDAADDDVAAEGRVENPEGRVAEGEALDEDAFAAEGLEEAGAKARAGAEDARGQGRAVVAELAEAELVGALEGLPGGEDARAGAVDHAVAGEGDVGGVARGDQGRVGENLGAFPALRDGREKIGGVAAEAQGGAAGEVKVDAA